jgi:FHA domain/zinc-ribbon domain
VYCPECGHHNREVARFCGRCGASLLEPEPGAEATMTFTPVVDEAQDGDPLADSHEGPTLVIRTGGNRAGEAFSIAEQRVRVGRAPQSHLFLDDITVSREHAELERRPDGVYLTDLGSLNGTYVNRRRVESVRLADGDELQIGKYRLTFIEHPA